MGVLDIVGIEDERHPHIRHAPQRLETGCGDPYDRAPLFELDAFAKDIAETAKALLPDAVANDNDGLGSRRPIARSEASAEKRLSPEHVEVLLRYQKSLHEPRLPAARQREARRGVRGKRLERARAVAKRLETLAGKVMLGPHADEPLAGIVSERSQDDVMDDAPDRDVRAHPERERHHRHRCKARGSAEASKRVGDVRAKRFRFEPCLAPEQTGTVSENRNLLPVPEACWTRPTLPQTMREELSQVLCYLAAFRQGQGPFEEPLGSTGLEALRAPSRFLQSGLDTVPQALEALARIAKALEGRGAQLEIAAGSLLLVAFTAGG